jgi:hypothetical protein
MICLLGHFQWSVAKLRGSCVRRGARTTLQSQEIARLLSCAGRVEAFPTHVRGDAELRSTQFLPGVRLFTILAWFNLIIPRGTTACK